jgi:NAD(P)-dependent dehydrogenase (short-subunit alcohol dehydrogenase family)
MNRKGKDMKTLEGKCAIVTGGAYGIGFAAAQRLASEGASVVISDIKGHEAAAQKLSDTGARVISITADVTKFDSVDQLVAQTMSNFGGIDILVNNAAISAELRPAPFEQASPEEWRRIYEVNVIGVFNMCKAVSPHIRSSKAGRIVNVTSGTAFKSTPGMLHYVASKGAIISMTRSLASEFSGDNVTVNAVSPGFTMTESVQNSPQMLSTFADAALKTRLLKRHAVAADVASVIYFLAGEDARFVTGQIIAADGGSVFH